MKQNIWNILLLIYIYIYDFILVSPQPTQPKSLLNIEEIPKKRTYSTWIHELFEGILTNEIKCLNCENVKKKKKKKKKKKFILQNISIMINYI